MGKRREVKGNKIKVGFLRLSGTLTFKLENPSQVNPWPILIRSLSKVIRYKNNSDGYYSFTGGRVSPLKENRNEGEAELSLEFKSARPRFMDLLANTILARADECCVSFSLRGIDFNVLREVLGLGGDEDNIQIQPLDNFEGLLIFDGTKIKVAAYPGASMVNIIAKIKKESLEPSNIIRKFYRKVSKDEGKRRI